MSEQGSDPGPIEPAYVELMNRLAHALDDIFNGEGCKPEDKTVGFFLTCFNFNETGGRFNYISNADALDVAATLRDILARLDGRKMPAGKA
jgi:hypothetical protein